MKRTTFCLVSLSLLLGALSLSGCGQSAAQKEADTAARWKNGMPGPSYAQEIDAKRQAAAKPGAGATGIPKSPPGH